MSNVKRFTAIKRLRDMLVWSDRIGSDEIYEIQSVIELLQSEDK